MPAKEFKRAIIQLFIEIQDKTDRWLNEIRKAMHVIRNSAKREKVLEKEPNRNLGNE